jgi:hypothetical protein
MQSKSWKAVAKKHLMLVAAVGLAIPGQFAVATPAVAASSSSPAQFVRPLCKFFVSLGVISSNDFGNCMGTQVTQTNYFISQRGDLQGAVAETCNWYLDNFPDYFYSQWDSFGECFADDAGFVIL